MRHLAFVESEIGRFGSRALRREIPVPVLRKALEQFDLLVQGAPSEGLIYLRARMAEAVELRGRAIEIDGHRDPPRQPGGDGSLALAVRRDGRAGPAVPLDAANSPARG